MKTQALYILLVLTMGTVACDKIAPPSEAPVAAGSMEHAADPVPTAEKAHSDFPEGVVPAFSYKVRSTATEQTAEGTLRKMVIEFKEGGVAEIDGQFEKLLAAEGYKRYKTYTNPDGGVVGDYGASNGRRVTVTTSNGADLVLSEGSLGIVYLVWR